MPYKDPIRQKEHSKEYHKRNRQKIIERAKNWRIENKDKYNEFYRKRYTNPIYREKHAKVVDNWRAKNLDRAREYSREYAKNHPIEQRRQWLKRAYGISLETYQILLESQNGKCAICGKENAHKRTKYLFVDHNHNTGKVRGLLCQKCNSLIGYSDENVNNLNMAIEYLKKYTN